MSIHPPIHPSVHPPMHSPIRPTIRASIHPSSIPALRKQGRCSHLSTGPEKMCSSHLNSFLPLADVLLAHVEPPHGPLSVPQVVLPLTGVDVPRGVAARTQALLFFFFSFASDAAAEGCRATPVRTISPPSPPSCCAPTLLRTTRSSPCCNAVNPVPRKKKGTVRQRVSETRRYLTHT